MMNKGCRNNRLIIIGASGHGKVVADIAKLCGYTEIIFLDDNPKLMQCGGYSIAGSTENLRYMEGDLFVAIGNAAIRRRLMELFSERFFPVLIHPNAVISETVTIGCGSVVMAGAVINPDTVIGKGCIVNTCASVDHDCSVEDFCHVAVGAHLCGTVSVGKQTWIGAGSTISNNIDICGHCMIGAGAVVINNIDREGTYVGVPAKIISCD